MPLWLTHSCNAKFVWINETGTDIRDQSRKYGYALHGQKPVVHHLQLGGKRVNATFAAISSARLVTVELMQNTFYKAKLSPTK